MFKKLILLFLFFTFILFSFNVYWETSNWKETKDLTKDITKVEFQIDVDDISPWMNHIKWDTNKTINFALGTIIQKLMIGLGSLSLLIMTVWAWYIVLHGWQDELLNKWKSIFMSGIYAMLVALSSYYLIVIVRYVLYA